MKCPTHPAKCHKFEEDTLPMKNSKFFQSRSAAVLILLCAAITIPSRAQTFTNLASLSAATGESPRTPLTQGLDGNLYGTAASAGAFNAGTFLQITPSGTVTDVYDFCFNGNANCPDGVNPWGAIALGPDGNFYGTTLGSFTGGDVSTVYKMTPAGGITILHTFCDATGCPDGEFATTAGLALARNGLFYGTSFPQDGSSAFDNVVFNISSSGHFNILLTVCPNQICPADAGPSGAFLQASGGNLISPGPGGALGLGAIYRMTPSGTPTVIYSFCQDSTCHDGGNGGANSPLVQAPGGNFFGTDFYGGAGAHCTLSQGCGTAFRVTAAGGGALTKLHDFCAQTNCADGATPNPLIQATDGNFYGTTTGGGTNNKGTVFKLNNRGGITVIHRFDSTDGANPETALLQATDGNLYGTTINGGTNGVGTVFRISLGLAPFVRTVQEAGAVGASVIILGNNLTGSTSVTFNGTAAAFTAVSDTEITTTVPTGATTGPIQVVTASSGTLSSNAAFVVTP
jgi:uncharacterized repeat protein (TIGR03803 family)